MSLVNDNEMAIVKRANVRLRVPKEEADKYVSRGFDVINEKGEVIKASTPTDISSLKVAYSRVLKENAKLKEEIEKLKSSKEPKGLVDSEVRESRPKKVVSKEK